jgi:hypothetical protein
MAEVISYVDLGGVVSILNIAEGSSVVSACTLACTPMFANAPRNIPQGNHRNCTQPSIISAMGSKLARGLLTGCARITALLPTSALILENGRKLLSVRT